jgi:hypothetical protein
MKTQVTPGKPAAIPRPVKQPEILPPADPGEPLILPEEDPEILPDEDPFETPPPFEVPEPGEGP